MSPTPRVAVRCLVLLSGGLLSSLAQPKGLAFTRDNLMLVSDEATTGPAVLTIHRKQE